MKVLVINGSPHKKGCTARALDEVIRALNADGVETELLEIGSQKLSGCQACRACKRTGKCVCDDIVNEAVEKLRAADGLLVGSPVYYASPNGTLLSFLDRLFYCMEGTLHLKVGAAVVSCRRGGAASAFDVLNKYFTIAGMPVVSSSYWNSVHGFTAADVEKDLEGLQTMRNLGHSMAFLVKSIALGKERFGTLEFDRSAFTSFPDGK